MHQYSISNATNLRNVLGAPVFSSPSAIAVSSSPPTFLVVDGRKVSWYLAGGDGSAYASFSASAPVGGVATDSQGRVYISTFISATTGAVVVLSLVASRTGVTVEMGPTLTASPIPLSSPSGLFVDAEFNVFVCDTGNARIVQLNSSDSTVINTFASNAVPLSNLTAVYVSTSSGLVYAVSDSRLVQFNPSTLQMAVLSSASVSLMSPVAVSGDSNGLLYVADAAWNAVLVLHADGSLYRQLNAQGGYPWQSVKALTVDANNSLWVVDQASKMVYVALPVPPPSVPSPPSSSSSPNAGLIAGVVIAGVVVLAVVAALVVYQYRRTRKQGMEMGGGEGGSVGSFASAPAQGGETMGRGIELRSGNAPSSAPRGSSLLPGMQPRSEI